MTTGKNPGCATQVRASSLYTLPSDASVQSLPALQAIPTTGPSLSRGAIAGIAVGGAVALAGILAAVFFIARRSRVTRRSGAVLDGVVDLVSEEDPDGPVVEPFKSGGSLRKPNPAYGESVPPNTFDTQGTRVSPPSPHPSADISSRPS